LRVPGKLCGVFFVLTCVATAGVGRLPTPFLRTSPVTEAGRFTVKTSRGTVLFREGGWDAGSIHLDYLGHKRLCQPVGLTETPYTVSRFSAFPDSGSARLATYDSLRYADLYPGIDLVVRLAEGSLKTEFDLKPGSKVSRIRWRYRQFEHIQARLDGTLESAGPLGSIAESPPDAWQEVGGKRVPVKMKYAVLRDGAVGLVAGPYDQHVLLVIDPILTFAQTMGGSGTDVITGVARDAVGNVYVSGWTDSAVFSTFASSFSPGKDVYAFVMKLAAATKSIVYLAYLGGSGEDRATGIAVDGDGYAFICGSTNSIDFPVVNAHQGNLNGSTNAFLAKLNPLGNRLLFSTYFGSGNTAANAIALDGSDNAYVAGQTDSTTLPTTTPFQAANGGALDAFAAKFNSSGTIQYSSYLGGSGNDVAYGVAVDATGDAYLTGSTTSTNFPVAGPFQATLRGGQDAFVTKINPAGSAMVYSTYLGGSGGGIGQPEEANAIVVDSLGDAFVAGTTSSVDFPVVNAYQPYFAGWNSDAFVAELNPAGAQLIFSTYLGGTDLDVVNAIELDSSGNIYVAGYTASIDFPTVQPIQAQSGGLYDTFVAELGPGGRTLLLSTYFGGAQNDIAYSMAGTNEVIVGGSTASVDRFPGVVGIDALEFGVQISPLAPFGTVDTPQNNSTGLSGAIAVTGWALCNDQVPTIGVWYAAVAGQAPGSLVFIGNASVINGSRPDVAADYPNYEFKNRGGWGLAVLTNLLPNSAGGSNPVGNGTYQFHAIATNLQGQAVDIGSKTVTVDNTHSVTPFGTIDTPAQGQTISGTYVNFGWAVTPQPATIPINGSTITVYIDGQAVAHPVYNNYRADIATIFPGLNNSNGAVGYYYINTTYLANGQHTISWLVTDNAGHAAGIGSRYFFVLN
jgi:hypothetical protein